MSFFCKPVPDLPEGIEACGLFSAGHWGLLLITAALIVLGLYFARNISEKKVRLTVRIVTAVLWALEVAKIIFVVVVNKETNPNHFIPLYYCSLILYAGLFSSLGRGWAQRIGDVFISTGGIIGGMCFMLLPTTSLPRYPMLHFISFHSFLLHGLMVFLGILMLMRGVCKLQVKDVYYCSGLISTMCVLATTFNIFWDANNPPDPENGIFGANLMFMSQDFPGTPVSLLYQWLDGPPLFSICMWLFQAFIPFFAVFGVYKLITYMNEMTAANRSHVNELEEITVQINGVSPEQSACDYQQEIE